MSHDGFGGRSKNHSSQSGAAVRRNHDQIRFLFRSNANNLGCGIAVHNYFYDVEADALFTLRELG